MAQKGPGTLSPATTAETTKGEVPVDRRELSRRFARFLENTSDWFWEQDTEHRLSFISRRGEESPPLPMDRALGHTRWDFAEADVVNDPYWRDHIAMLDRHEPFRDFRYSFRADDGHTYYRSISGDPVFDDDGTFQGYRGIASDVTAEVEAQLRAEAAEVTLQEVTSALPDGFMLFDEKGRLLSCNDRAKEIYADVAHLLVPGMRFEDLLRTAVAYGMFPEADGREEVYVAERMAHHVDGTFHRERRHADGRWVVSQEGKTSGGHTYLLLRDVTDRHQREQDLEARERLFRSAFENSFQGMVIHDGEQIVHVNDAAAEMFGYRRDEVMGMSIWNVVAEADQARLKGYRDGRSSSGDNMPRHYQFTGRTKDGRPVSIETMVSLVDWGGQQAFLAAMIDRSQSDVLKRAADEAHARLLDAIESIDSGFALFDEDDRLVLYNSRYPLFPGAAETILKPGRSYEEITRLALASGIYGDLSAEEIETRLAQRLAYRRNPVGAIELPLADGRWLRVVDCPTNEGGIVTISTDVTDRVRAERETRRSEAKYRDLVDGSIEGIVIHRDYRIVYANRAAADIYGYTIDELLGTDVTHLIAPEERARLAAYREARSKGELVPERYEHLGLKKNGTRVWLDIQVREVEWNGETAVQSTLIDVSERKRAEFALREAKEAAERANRMKTEFLANMSHELRTPLNSIIGFSELVATESLGPLGEPRYKAYLEDINRSGRHLLELINDILDVSLIEAGEMRMDDSVIELAHLVEVCVAMVAERAMRGGVAVETDLAAAADIRIRGDERRLRQIMLNLLTNAIKFTNEGGRVMVRLDRSDGGVRVTVEDTGIGISKDDQERVLEPFMRGDSSYVRSRDGTGLGLPLVKRLAESHDATLSLESEYGVGTVVRVVFPSSRIVATDVGDDAAN